MSLEVMSEEHLQQARGDHIREIRNLNEEISAATFTQPKAERRALGRKRTYEYQELKAIDAEFERVGSPKPSQRIQASGPCGSGLYAQLWGTSQNHSLYTFRLAATRQRTGRANVR